MHKNRQREQQIQKLVRGTIEHEQNPNAYTLSGSGKVNEDETIFEPTEVAAVPVEQVMEPADNAKTNENQNEARNNENQNEARNNRNRMNAEVIRNLTEARNNEQINDPDRVTEVNPRTGDEVLCVQLKVSLKTEDGTVIGTVPAIMIPVKRGAQYISEAAKKLKEKEAEVTRTLEEKNRKQKQRSENIWRYVLKAQSGNEALEYFAKKDEERKWQIQEKEWRKEERMAKKEEKSKLTEQRKQEQIKKKLEWESKKLRLELARITAKAKKGLSFVPDTESEGDVSIDVNKCFKCDEEFDPEDKEVYGCDHCPHWYHRRCLPAAVLAMAEAEGQDLADVDVDCDYCCYWWWWMMNDEQWMTNNEDEWWVMNDEDEWRTQQQRVIDHNIDHNH